ncbi:MAG: ATP-binding protein [Chitinophagaceae bacterium]
MDANKTKIFYAVLITAVFLIVILAYFFISLIRQQRRNKALYQSKILAEITTLEKERARTAADLHDELGPVLSSVKMRVNSLDIGSEDDKEQLEKINKHIDDIITRMRGISNDLMPSTLLRKGLVAAAKEFVNTIEKPKELNIHFTHGDIPELTNETNVNLYRILQEVIHNTIKHANATELRIELTVRGNCFILLSEDNGKGFDYNLMIKEKSGLGLRNLLSRTEIMGGDMYIESSPGKNTRYTFEIPV